MIKVLLWEKWGILSIFGETYMSWILCWKSIDKEKTTARLASGISICSSDRKPTVQNSGVYNGIN